jgi:hypothetical protein
MEKYLQKEYLSKQKRIRVKNNTAENLRRVEKRITN